MAKLGRSLYVHSPIGLCGMGKILRVKTSVKVANRENFADGNLRGKRVVRCGTDDGLTPDATETDVVLNNGADNTRDSCEEVNHILLVAKHCAHTTDEAYTSLAGVPNVSPKMSEELFEYAKPTPVIIEAYKSLLMTPLCR